MSPAASEAQAGLNWPTRGEWRWAGAAAALLMLLTCLPYLFGLAITPAGSYYSGFLTNPDEHNVYLSQMRQARDGAFRFADPFTTELQQGRVINVLWLKLGLLARITHAPLPLVYHVARVVTGWLLLLALYLLAAQVMAPIGLHRAALLLAALGSGLGWLFHPGPGQPNPIDFGPGLVMPEAITFLTLLLNPLFCASVLLLLMLYLAAGNALLTGSWRSALVAGFSGLMLGNIHSYDMVPAAVVLTAFLVHLLATRRAGFRAVLLALLIAALSAPSLLYQLWLQRQGEIALVVKAVNQPPSPEPVYVLLGLGLPLALALVGAVRATRGNDWARLLVIWLALGFALVYAPIPFQRKLIEGLYVPICLLAIVALEPLRKQPMRGRIMATLVVACALPSSLYFVARGVGDLVTNNQAYLANLMPPLYLNADQHAAMLALDRAGEGAVLGNSLLSNYVPSLTGKRVYLGHWSETPDFSRRVGEYAHFLRADTPDAEREAFARAHGISYVLRDATLDRAFLPPGTQAFDPSRAHWLEPRFAQGEVQVWRVREASP